MDVNMFNVGLPIIDITVYCHSFIRQCCSVRYVPHRPWL